MSTTDPENAVGHLSHDPAAEWRDEHPPGGRRLSRQRWILAAAALVVVALVIILPLVLVQRDEPSPSPQELTSTSSSPTASSTGASAPAPPTNEVDPATTGAPSPPPTTPPPTGAPSPPPTTPAPTGAPTGAPTSSPTTPRSSIVLAVLPDSQYAVEGAPYIFRAQVEWLRSHHASLGRPFVVHVGDVVQGPGVEAQWESGKGAMDLLTDEGIDYAVSSGNHDIRQSWKDDVDRDADEPYLKYFGPSSGRTVNGRDDTGWSEYHLASVLGVELLVLALDWRATSGTLSWARDVLREHPQTPAILVSHDLLYPTADAVVRSAYGDYIWDELVEKENQIFVVLCGHVTGSGWREDVNAFGASVPQVLINYQEDFAGGNGNTRLIELDFVRNTIQHFTFSPWVQRLWQEEGAEALAPHDLAILREVENDFAIPTNLTERFAGIGATVPAELTERPGVPWLDAVRSELGEVPLPSVNFETPDDTDDYPSLPETAAHWRFDGIAADGVLAEGGQSVPIDALIADLSGNGNHLIRRNTTGGIPEHLTVSRSGHPLSAAGASLCFSNPDRSEGAYLATVDGSPINDATFDAGYTVEAFVKLPPTFLDDGSPFRWTGVVARAGLITDVFEGEDMEGDANEPLAVLGLSNLAEMQFASWPIQQESETRKVVTAWSSPLELERWYHVAVVNDGNQTRLYVDGWPARRDPVYEVGVAGLPSAGGSWLAGLPSAGGSWLVGASFYADRTKVFGGCIGEVRITARALAADEMLLSRRKEE